MPMPVCRMLRWALRRSRQQLGPIFPAKYGQLVPVVFPGCVQWGGRLHTTGFGFVPLRLHTQRSVARAPVLLPKARFAAIIGPAKVRHNQGVGKWHSELCGDSVWWHYGGLGVANMGIRGHTSSELAMLLRRHKNLGAARTQLTFSTTADYNVSTRFGALARSLHNQVFGGYGLWPAPWLKVRSLLLVDSSQHAVEELGKGP